MSELIKHTGNNAIVKKADNYLSHLGALLQKRYAPDLPEFIPYRKGDQWGFCNRDKKIVIVCKYDEVIFFSEGYCFSKLKGQWFIVGSNGKEISATGCDQVFGNGFNNGRAFASSDVQLFQIDYSGNKKKVYVIPRKTSNITIADDGNKYGIATTEGNWIVKPIYDYAEDIREGLFAVRLAGFWGFIDETGKEVGKMKYYRNHYAPWGDFRLAVGDFYEGFSVVSLGDKCGYVDKNGNEITPIKYSTAYPFSEGLGLVSFDGKYGFIDKTGAEIIPPIYYYANSFSEGLAYVSLNGKKAFIDKHGVIKFYCRYHTSIFVKFREGLAVVESNDKKGFINKQGELVIPFQFDDAHDFSGGFMGGLAKVEINKKAGFINQAGEIVIPCTYNAQTTFSKNVTQRFQHKDSSNEEFVDMLNQDILTLYPDVEVFDIPQHYKYVSDFTGGLALVTMYECLGKFVRKAAEGYIDKLGNEYWED